MSGPRELEGPSEQSLDLEAARTADRLGRHPELRRDLGERALPIVPAAEFDRVIQDTWLSPDTAIGGGESNANAQARGLAVVRSILAQHVGQHLVVAAHGNTSWDR